MNKNRKAVYTVFFMALLLNAAYWHNVKSIRAAWENVPPVPSKAQALNFSLGDGQLSYRSIGIMLQNLGSTGGRIVPLHEYNYDKLVEWFFLTDSLDPKSNFISRLAAYYYGSSQDKEDLRKLLVFLEKQGTANTGRKWLLLVYGMKIARYELGDMDKALHFANLLANLDNPDMPDWTRRAPAIILSAKGDKEAAYRILVNLLKSEGEKIHPNEVNFIVHHICEDLLSSVEAINNPVCRNIYR